MKPESIPAHLHRRPTRPTLKDGNARQGRGTASVNERRADELERVLDQINDGTLIVKGRPVRDVKAGLRARIRKLRS